MRVGVRLLKSTHAFYYHATRAGLYHRVMRAVSRLRHIFWSIATASDIRPGARLGKNVLMLHPTGIVIHQNAIVGDNCVIMQQVTLGQLLDHPGVPNIGNGVVIGAGAKVLGGVVVGDRAKIGANSVVLKDVPADATVVGIPARVVRHATMRDALGLECRQVSMSRR